MGNIEKMTIEEYRRIENRQRGFVNKIFLAKDDFAGLEGHFSSESEYSAFDGWGKVVRYHHDAGAYLTFKNNPTNIKGENKFMIYCISKSDSFSYDAFEKCLSKIKKLNDVCYVLIDKTFVDDRLESILARQSNDYVIVS